LILKSSGFSYSGNFMVFPPVWGVWKLILKKVHWPWAVSEADLIVEMWKGMKVVGEFGINTQ